MKQLNVNLYSSYFLAVVNDFCPRFNPILFYDKQHIFVKPLDKYKKITENYLFSFYATKYPLSFNLIAPIVFPST